MKHLIIDVRVVLELWFNRGDAKTVAVERLLSGSHAKLSLWITASSISMLECLVIQKFEQGGVEPEEARIRLNEMFSELFYAVNVLSCYGYQVKENFGTVRSFGDAQIALAAQSIQGEKKIVTRNLTFDTQDLIDILSPEDALNWIVEEGEITRTDFIDLKTQQDRIRPLLENNINNVFLHGQYIMGPEVSELEEKLADFVGTKYCIGVSSGTDALLIAMMSLEIGAGDEVITSPFTFIATGEMIALLGAKPVFVDIDSNTYNINPNKIEAAITPKTKAIMPVSLYGQCADYDAINKIADRYGIPVIEDGAQSLGATYKNRQSCSLTTIGCTSFFPSKPLGGYGDGGACFTNDDKLAKLMREVRVHGQDRRYHHPRVGINGRLDTLQAAVILSKLSLFQDEINARKTIGGRYTDLINNFLRENVDVQHNGLNVPGDSQSIVPPFIESHNTSVYAQYTIQVDCRAGLQEKLKTSGIPTAVHYPVPLNQQPALVTDEYDLPISKELSSKVMSLPMHPYLSSAAQRNIVKHLFSSMHHD